MATPYQLTDLIVTRLASLEVPVRHVADLTTAMDAQMAPAVLVIPYGLQVVDDGAATSIRETVLVVAVTRSANQRSGQAARSAAGPLLAEAATLLTHWQPDTGHTPLDIESPPAPQFVEGTALYPLQFASNYSLTE